MPIHLLIPPLKRLVAAALLLLPLAASADDSTLPDGLYAEITTPKGLITCQLDYDKAPLTVTSFVGLAEGTLGPAPRNPFFNDLTFHRVVPDFVIQGGDPLGTGEGDPGYSFPDEFSGSMRHDAIGVLSMANDGPDTNGSQFFITLGPSERLNFLYSVFGHTIGGLDVLKKIEQGDQMFVRILRIGPAAQAFKADDAAFAAQVAKAHKYTGEKDAGPKSHFDDPDKIFPMDPPRAQLFTYKLANLERMTGQKAYARVFAKFIPASPSDSPDASATRMAETLGLAENGVLAVYFQDSEKWYLKVGKGMAGRFASASGPGKPDDKAALDAGIIKFFADAQNRETRYVTESQKPLAYFLQIPSRHTKLTTDAVVDQLVFKLAN
ncbi:MAG TPA: peptidylprolyl isomerase [Opitutaceae bacterium]|nr:peptidylprolyl isomerase [Opitutaceae bacterium]